MSAYTAQARSSGREEAARRFYMPELDALRFFAFLAVFIFHLPPWGVGIGMYQRHGFVGSLGVAGAFGVDLFFALSAYLISKLLSRERIATGKIDLKGFYVRRLLRIWPLYFFYLTLAFSVCHFMSRFIDSFAIDTIYFGVLSIFLGNLYISFWGEPARLLTPLWSISVEEQFYLLWPLWLRKVSERGLMWAGLTLLASTSGARLVFSALGLLGKPVWYSSFTRLDPIAIGILIAAIPERKILDLRPRPRFALLVLGIASWWLVAYYCDPFSLKPTALKTMLGYPGIALGSGAFLLAALGAGEAGAGFMLNPLLIYLGRISYGLYVYHDLVLEMTQLFMLRFVLYWLLGNKLPLWLGWPIYIALSFSATVMLAAASYRWLEAPFLRLKRRFTHVPSRPV